VLCMCLFFVKSQTLLVIIKCILIVAIVHIHLPHTQHTLTPPPPLHTHTGDDRVYAKNSDVWEAMPRGCAILSITSPLGEETHLWCMCVCVGGGGGGGGTSLSHVHIYT